MDNNNKSEQREGHTDSPSAGRPSPAAAGANFFDDGFRESLGRYPAVSGVFPASFPPTNLSVEVGFQVVAPLTASRQAPDSDVHQTSSPHQFAPEGRDFAGYHTTIQADRPAGTDAQPPFQDNSFWWGAAGGEPSVSLPQVNPTSEQGGFQPKLLPHSGAVGRWSPTHPPINLFHHTTSHIAEPSAQFLSMIPGVSATGYAAFTLGSVAAPNQTQLSEGDVGTSVTRMHNETETAANLVDHSVTILQPQKWDILYGRGKQHRNHPGNKRMKLLVDLHRDAYSRTDRTAKTNMSKEIVNIIKSSGDKSGRFLRFDKKVKGWIEVSDESAREKISHAMRDGKTKSLERIDPKVLEEMPLLSDQIKQDALRKLAASKPTGETSSPACEQFNADDLLQG